MFLGLLTILTVSTWLLAIVAKYVTWMHMTRMSQRKVVAENLCNRNEQRRNLFVKERQAAEAEEAQVHKERGGVEAELEKLKHQLSERQARNQDLRDQIEGR